MPNNMNTHKDLSKELIKVQKLRVKAHLGMRLLNSGNEELCLVFARLFSIEDNWGFWETIKRNKFWRYDLSGRLVRYYDAIQNWYNLFSIQERNKDEWLYFGKIELPWQKEKTEFSDLINL